MKLLTLALLLGLASNSLVSAQSDNEYYVGFDMFLDPLTRGKLDIIAGYQNIDGNIFEIGIAKGYRGYEGYGYFYANYHLSSEIILADNYEYIKLIGTKVGYKYSLLFFDITLQAIYYNDLKKSAFALRPELGFSIWGIIDVNYGHNIFIVHPYTRYNVGSVLAIRFTLGNGVNFHTNNN